MTILFWILFWISGALVTAIITHIAVEKRTLTLEDLRNYTDSEYITLLYILLFLAVWCIILLIILCIFIAAIFFIIWSYVWWFGRFMIGVVEPKPDLKIIDFFTG